MDYSNILLYLTFVIVIAICIKVFFIHEDTKAMNKFIVDEFEKLNHRLDVINMDNITDGSSTRNFSRDLTDELARHITYEHAMSRQALLDELKKELQK